MRRRWLAAAGLAAFVFAGVQALAQGGAEAWQDPQSWSAVKPVETDNIVFENVPLIANPSASPNPGTPGGIRAPLPNTAPPGTLDLHVDLYLIPAKKPTPVVIQFHGGGWIRGDRPDSFGTFRALLAAGMSVVTVQYRNAKDAPAPAAVQDVRCAMAWVKANAAKYNFDMNRVILYGGSAGGHLALMGGYAPSSFDTPGCTDQPKVAAVLDFYGPTNLVEGLSEHGSASSIRQWLGTQLPLPSTGSTPAGRPAPPQWPAPDAKTLALARKLSPMTYVKAGVPPTYIVNGEKDPAVDPTQDAQLKKALDAAGVLNGQYIVPGGGHGNFPPAEADKAMLLCLQFLKAQGILE